MRCPFSSELPPTESSHLYFTPLMRIFWCIVSQEVATSKKVILAALMCQNRHAEPGNSSGWRHPANFSLDDPQKSNSPLEPLHLCLQYLWGPPPLPSASAHPADEPGEKGKGRSTHEPEIIFWCGIHLIYSHFLMFPCQVCATFQSLSWSPPSCTRSGGKAHGVVRNIWP